jgi:hypothetical protein
MIVRCMRAWPPSTSPTAGSSARTSPALAILMAALLVGGLLTALPTQAAAAPEEPTPDEQTSSAAEVIDDVLRRERVTLDFQLTPLRDVVARLQDTVWLNIVLASEVDHDLPVTLSAAEEPLGQVLDPLLEGHGLARSVWCGVLYIHQAEAVLPDEPVDEVPSRLPGYTCRFAGTPLAEALSSLNTVSGVELSLSAAAAEQAQETPIELRVRNLPLHQLLTLVTDQAGLCWALEGERVRIEAPGEGHPTTPDAPLDPSLETRLDEVRVSVQFEETSLEDVVAFLRGVSGLSIRLDAEVQADRLVSLVVDQVSLRQALDALVANAGGLRWRLGADGVSIDPRRM